MHQHNMLMHIYYLLII